MGGEKRLACLPDVPTFTELGYPSLNASGWSGVAVRAETPGDVINQLHGAVTQAIQAEDVRRRFGDLGIVPDPQSPLDFGRFIQVETARWGEVIRSAGVSLG